MFPLKCLLLQAKQIAFGHRSSIFPTLQKTCHVHYAFFSGVFYFYGLQYICKLPEITKVQLVFLNAAHVV